MKKYPATNVDDAYAACNPEEALRPGDERHVDLSAARGTDRAAETITLRIRRTRPPEYLRQLVTGHKGSGKTTELRFLQKCLEDSKLFTVFLNVEEVLDLGEVKYLDVLLAMARALENETRKQRVAVNPELLKNLENWFCEKTLTKSEQTDVEAALRAEAGIEAGWPLLAKLLVKATSQFKSGSTRRMEIRQEMERDLGLFINYLNLLIRDARDKVRARGFQDIVIIVDSLEKMHFREDAEGKSPHYDLFVDHAEQLKAPDCHLIYTVPIWLFFEAGLGDVFSAASHVIPMVRHWTDAGKDSLRKIVTKRVELENVYEDPSDVDKFIELSGGSTRDLLRLLRMSFDNVIATVKPSNSQQAMTALVREYDRLLRDEDMEKLDDVEKLGRVPSTQGGYARFLRDRLIHEYDNDPRIAKVHPAVFRCMQKRKKTP